MQQNDGSKMTVLNALRAAAPPRYRPGPRAFLRGFQKAFLRAAAVERCSPAPGQDHGGRAGACPSVGGRGGLER